MSLCSYLVAGLLDRADWQDRKLCLQKCTTSSDFYAELLSLKVILSGSGTYEKWSACKSGSLWNGPDGEGFLKSLLPSVYSMRLQEDLRTHLTLLILEIPEHDNIHLIVHRLMGATYLVTTVGIGQAYLNIYSVSKCYSGDRPLWTLIRWKNEHHRPNSQSFFSSYPRHIWQCLGHFSVSQRGQRCCWTPHNTQDSSCLP